MAKLFYANDIMKKKSDTFGKAIIMGEVLKGAKLKSHIAKLAKGGRTSREIREELKKAGVKGEQYKKIEKFINLIKGGCKKEEALTEDQKKKNLRYGMKRDLSVLEERSKKRAERTKLGLISSGSGKFKSSRSDINIKEEYEISAQTGQTFSSSIDKSTYTLKPGSKDLKGEPPIGFRRAGNF